MKSGFKILKILIILAIFAGVVAGTVLLMPKIFNKNEEISNNTTKNETKTDEKEKEPLYVVKARESLEKMTLEEKVGQMLFSRVPESDALSDIENYHLGGYILFGRDIEGESLESIREKVGSWQKISKIPMLIGIDEEGGTVSRLSYAGLFVFRSPKELYSEGGMEKIRSDTEEKAKILSQIGVNVNFAPVADTCETEGAFIYDRSLGKDAAETAEFVKTSVEAYKGSGVSPTLKHFPGYGDNADTHTRIAIDERSLESFRERDFLPFIAGIKAGAEIVMVSHNIITSVDDTEPASISPKIHEILRDELKFDGIILTDDLTMDAISEYYFGEYPAEVQAVLAGNTMLIISNYREGFENILYYLKSGVIPEKQIDEAVKKILEFKYKNIL